MNKHDQQSAGKKKSIKIILYALPVLILILDCFYWYSIETSIRQMNFTVDGLHNAMKKLPIETLKKNDRMKLELKQVEIKKDIIDALTKVRPKNLYPMTNTFMSCLHEKELSPEWLRLKSKPFSKEKRIYDLKAGFKIGQKSAEKIKLMECIDKDPYLSKQEPVDVTESSDGRELEIRVTLTQD